jgi:hypothetical protein
MRIAPPLIALTMVCPGVRPDRGGRRADDPSATRVSAYPQVEDPTAYADAALSLLVDR